MKINEQDIDLDPEGYLVNPSDWNKAVALALAQAENIKLTDEHWNIFNFMRNFYAEHQVLPDVRHTTKYMAEYFVVDKKTAKAKLFNLFPYGYVKQACKIAGMRRPRAWSTG